MTRSISTVSLLVVGLFLAIWIAVFVATHIPRDDMPDLPSDKLTHFAAYGTLATLACWAISYYRHLTVAGLGMIVGLFGLWCAFDEWSQQFVDRTPDVQDWIADMVGVVFGAALFVVGRGWSARAALETPREES